MSENEIGMLLTEETYEVLYKDNYYRIKVISDFENCIFTTDIIYSENSELHKEVLEYFQKHKHEVI